MTEQFDVVVVGSGAGGGVVAGELAQCGRRVLLLEAGPHLTSADFRRWEAKADHDLYWPLRFAPLPDGDVLTFLGGRCVGGSTTINTKVALRAHERDIAKWHPASSLTNERGEPFSLADLAEYYDRVESVLQVRERDDWEKCVRTVQAGFRALGADLEPVMSYTDAKCMKYGSCLQGCPTDGGKSTMNTYIAMALAQELLQLRTGVRAERVLVDGAGGTPRASGVEYVDAVGGRHTAWARFVVVAAGALASPVLLLRSGLANPMIGRHVGLHPVRLVHGLFDETQDAHRVYPITAHCMQFQTDEAGGFVIEASTLMDPIAFATTARDESGPLWGPRLRETVRAYRRWNGLLAMINDENNASVRLGADGRERYEVDFDPTEHARLDAALRFSRQVLEAAGARKILWTGLISTHTQGGCRMGDDPARSVVDRNCESHEVKGLFVGDASVLPRTLSVNPSLTVMALATRLAEHLEMAMADETAPA
ncbi:MAG: GMC family oxidoreductase [Burkholderiaceae bacterium]|nr:GMC family oxidoreductase [Burkholderiaceae bacterium]